MRTYTKCCTVGLISRGTGMLHRLLNGSMYVVLTIGFGAWPGCVQAGPDDKLPSNAYLDPIDQKISQSGIEQPGRPFPCAREKSDSERTYIETLPIDKCVKMLPAQRYHGLWRNDFEASQFCPAPAGECTFQRAKERVWLTFARDPLGFHRDRFGGLYEIEFFGRRTKYKGAYGHLGASDYEVIVDRIVSMREIEAPPPQPTSVEQDRWWQACVARGNCVSLDDLKKMHRQKQ